MVEKSWTSDWGVQIPLFCNKDSNCTIGYEKGRNVISISNLTSKIYWESDHHAPFKNFKSKDISIELHDEDKSNKHKSITAFFINIEGRPSFQIFLFIEPRVFNFLSNSIVNSGKDFLNQLRFNVHVLDKDLIKIPQFLKDKKAINGEVKKHSVIFSTNHEEIY
jgi:hypothetical protein